MQYEIENIKGVGPKLVQKIIETYNTYDNFLSDIKNYNIEKLVNIQGLSQKKALEIVQYIHGKNENYIKTQQAQNIHQQIIENIQEYANTTYTKNRIQLLTPTNNLEKIKQTNKLIQKTINQTKDLDFKHLRELYQQVKPLKEDIKPKFSDNYAIVCEEYTDYMKLLEKDLNKYSNIHPIEEQINLNQYDYVIYLYDQYNIEPPEDANIITVQNTKEDYQIQPNKILEYYKQNKKTLQNIYNIRKYLNQQTIIDKVLEILDTLEDDETKTQNIQQTVEEIKQEADNKISRQIKNIKLQGEEILQLLNQQDNLPEKLKQIYNTTLDEAREKIAEKTGILFDPFIIKYPLELDKEEINRIQQTTQANKYIKQYEKQLQACEQLEEYKTQIQKETIQTIQYDYQLTLANFYKDYQLTIPEIKDTYQLEEAIHIRLKQEEIKQNKNIQPINYRLDRENNIILLTGANSGGKTTLLETIAQQNMMAHMGIGVCAKKATIAQTDKIYYFTKKQSLNAGAFETFLKTFIPAAVGDEKKLILIDELESITELEAAIKITTGFIEQIQDKQNYAIIVTHMAPEILKQTQNIKIRTDGIEAKGLDENNNLIVDRNPKINHLAKSTPELILKKIYKNTKQPEKEIYKKILEKF